MTLLYFAWLRERIGLSREEVDPPAGITDVAGLLEWLRGRGPAYALALANTKAIRVAVNQQYSRPDSAIAPGDEIALFPPVTGG
jgi:molybdopterin synthase sulfur carrier subunit